jgi:hypothetical protein
MAQPRLCILADASAEVTETTEAETAAHTCGALPGGRVGSSSGFQHVRGQSQPACPPGLVFIAARNVRLLIAHSSACHLSAMATSPGQHPPPLPPSSSTYAHAPSTRHFSFSPTQEPQDRDRHAHADQAVGLYQHVRGFAILPRCVPPFELLMPKASIPVAMSMPLTLPVGVCHDLSRTKYLSIRTWTCKPSACKPAASNLVRVSA